MIITGFNSNPAIFLTSLKVEIKAQKNGTSCSGSAKSQPEAVTEHLVGRQGQPREAQVHAMYLSDWKGGARMHPFPDLI